MKIESGFKPYSPRLKELNRQKRKAQLEYYRAAGLGDSDAMVILQGVVDEFDKRIRDVKMDEDDEFDRRPYHDDTY